MMTDQRFVRRVLLSASIVLLLLVSFVHQLTPSVVDSAYHPAPVDNSLIL